MPCDALRHCLRSSFESATGRRLQFTMLECRDDRLVYIALPQRVGVLAKSWAAAAMASRGSTCRAWVRVGGPHDVQALALLPRKWRRTSRPSISTFDLRSVVASRSRA